MPRNSSTRKIGNLIAYQDDAAWTRFHLLPNLVVYEHTPLIKVVLTSQEVRTPLSFTSPGATMWEVTPAAAGRGEHTFEISSHGQQGKPISSGAHRKGDTQRSVLAPRHPSACSR